MNTNDTDTSIERFGHISTKHGMGHVLNQVVQCTTLPPDMIVLILSPNKEQPDQPHVVIVQVKA